MRNIPAFNTLLKAETLKAKNSLALWLTILGTIGNLFIFFFLNWFGLGHHPFGEGKPAWEVFVLNNYEGIAFMMLPLFIIILATLLHFMEHRSGTWALLMSLPADRTAVYLSKLVFGLLLFIAAHLAFIFGILLSGLLMGLLRPEYTMPVLEFPIGLVGGLGIKTFFSILGLFALHLWISLRFSNFIIPLTLGILGFVLTSILSPAFPYQWLNPYAYPICYMPDHNGTVGLPNFGFWSLHDLMSVLWGLGFTWLGIVAVRRMAFS